MLCVLKKQDVGLACFGGWAVVGTTALTVLGRVTGFRGSPKAPSFTKRAASDGYAAAFFIFLALGFLTAF